jgi:hypothetical protein
MHGRLVRHFPRHPSRSARQLRARVVVVGAAQIGWIEEGHVDVTGSLGPETPPVALTPHQITKNTRTDPGVDDRLLADRAQHTHHPRTGPDQIHQSTVHIGIVVTPPVPQASPGPFSTTPPNTNLLARLRITATNRPSSGRAPIPTAQRISTTSHEQIVRALRERNHRLNQENKQLRDELAVALGQFRELRRRVPASG